MDLHSHRVVERERKKEREKEREREREKKRKREKEKKREKERETRQWWRRTLKVNFLAHFWAQVRAKVLECAGRGSRA